MDKLLGILMILAIVVLCAEQRKADNASDQSMARESSEQFAALKINKKLHTDHNINPFRKRKLEHEDTDASAQILEKSKKVKRHSTVVKLSQKDTKAHRRDPRGSDRIVHALNMPQVKGLLDSKDAIINGKGMHGKMLGVRKLKHKMREDGEYSANYETESKWKKVEGERWGNERSEVKLKVDKTGKKSIDYEDGICLDNEESDKNEKRKISDDKSKKGTKRDLKGNSWNEIKPMSRIKDEMSSNKSLAANITMKERIKLTVSRNNQEEDINDDGTCMDANASTVGKKGKTYKGKLSMKHDSKYNKMSVDSSSLSQATPDAEGIPRKKLAEPDDESEFDVNLSTDTKKQTVFENKSKSKKKYQEFEGTEIGPRKTFKYYLAQGANNFQT